MKVGYLYRRYQVTDDALGMLCGVLVALLIVGMTPAGAQETITMVAGNGNYGYPGDSGAAMDANLDSPWKVAVDAARHVYVADSLNNRIRKISASNATPEAWTPTNSNLTDSDVTALVVDPSDSDALYAGTRSRGLLESADGGATWSSAGLDFPTVSILTVDPHNSSRLFAGYCDFTYFGILFRSEDGGDSWTQVIIPSQWTQINSIAISQANPDVIYVTVYNSELSLGFLRTSTDGGKTWVSNTRDYTESPWFLVVDPTDTATLYALQYGQSLRSTDRGETWTPCSLEVGSVVADPHTGTLYAIARGSVYRSLDRGDTWDGFGEGLAERVQALAVSGSNPGVVFAGTYGSGVFKNVAMLTLDRMDHCVGASWKLSIVNAPANAAIRLVGVSNGVPWEWPGWGTTDSGGNYSANGTFAEGSQGSHSLNVEIGGILSNRISLSISDCRSGESGPRAHGHADLHLR